MPDNRRSGIVDPAPEDTEGLTDLPDADTARRLAEATRNPMSAAGRQPVRDAQGGNQPQRPEWIPEKFWDGDLESSSKKLAESYGNLESDRGRLANEVGTLRHLVDDALDLKRTQDLQDNGGVPDDDDQPVTADDLLNDPDKALGRAISRHTKPITEALTTAQQERALADFQDRHPTFQEDLQDEKFLGWVGQSAYRRKLAQRVYESEKRGQRDFDAAEELWSGWDEAKPAAADTAPEGEQDKGGKRPAADDVSQAALTTRGGAESEVDHRPIYSRAALVKKRMDDQAGYYDPDFQKLIMQAYAEGRVR